MKLDQLKCINEDIKIDEYIKYINSVKESMKYPEWLGDFSKEDLIFLLNNNSKIWMYYLNNEFVCSMMLIPANKKSLTSFGIDLNPEEVIDYGPIFINHKYIGNGLQYQMLQKLDEYCIKSGYKYAISTVHPDNIYSINNLVKDKFINIDSINLKRGKRNIYLKCLEKNSIQKILTIVKKENKFLLLKGSDNDPQFHKSFWYVVTGSTEDCDNTLVDTVKREIKEETNLELKDTYRLPYILKYESLGKHCIEYMFISHVYNGSIKLNEESIEYRWCDIDEFIDLIKWYGDKKVLREVLGNIK